MASAGATSLSSDHAGLAYGVEHLGSFRQALFRDKAVNWRHLQQSYELLLLLAILLASNDSCGHHCYRIG